MMLAFATPVQRLCRVPRTRLFSSTSVSDRGGAIIKGANGALIHLPPAESPVGRQLYKKAMYCPSTQTLRTSAHVGTDDDNVVKRGTVGVGADLITPEDANTYAHNAGLRLLATIHHQLDGDLSRVEQVLKLEGMVNAEPNFIGHLAVIDGCSQVLVDAFGEDRGVGVRACFGVGSLGGAASSTPSGRPKKLSLVFKTAISISLHKNSTYWYFLLSLLTASEHHGMLG